VEKSTLFYYKYKCDPNLEAVMNYLKTYCNLIREAEKRGYTKKKAKEQGLYVEGHHTFPKSIYGNNKRIVYLTAREHYIAHALLERICIRRYGLEHWKTKKMTNAHIIMGGTGKYKNSYIYEEAKKRYSENRTGVSMKESSKLKLRNQRLGKKQSPEVIEIVRQKNTGKKRTQEQKDRMSKVQKGIQKSTLKVRDEEFKNKFIDVVTTSKTKKEIIIKLGKNPKSGSSSALIDKWANFLNLDMSHLIGSSINKGKIRTKESREKMSSCRKGKTKTEEHKKKIKLSNCKYTYTFITTNGDIIETVWFSDFCKENNLNHCKMREVARGVRKHHKGWKATRRPITDDDK
jgi:hypothetical protein